MSDTTSKHRRNRSTRRISAPITARTWPSATSPCSFEPGQITALIGPSGCGKSTLLRCLNRMHEIIPGTRVEGEVLLDGQNLYEPGVNPTAMRQRIGMVFQRPNPFPTMSIMENVLAGVRLDEHDGNRCATRRDRRTRAFAKPRCGTKSRTSCTTPVLRSPGGQQQRLCIARALAVEPEVLLMDEPASALDPISTIKIEELMRELKGAYTFIIVTHNMQQAARVFRLHRVSCSPGRMSRASSSSSTRRRRSSPPRRTSEQKTTSPAVLDNVRLTSLCRITADGEDPSGNAQIGLQAQLRIEAAPSNRCGLAILRRLNPTIRLA